MILGSKIPSGTSDLVYRFNSDSASNYAIRFSDNGGSHGTGTSQGRVLGDNGGATTPSFQVGYVANKSDQEKMIINHAIGQSTAGNAPIRRESTGKWVNTSNTISSVQGIQQESGDLASGSEVVVLGYDPDDTHTDNFWEELVDASGSGASFNTGTFTAKKYLWIQCWYKATGGGLNVGLQVGNNTISSSSGDYTYRTNQNGSSDSTNTTANNIVLDSATTDSGETGFANIFVVNNSSDEKLFIISQNSVVATGAQAPNRRETVAKFVNTTNQINIVGLYDAGTGGSFTSSSFIKVWGAD